VQDDRNNSALIDI